MSYEFKLLDQWQPPDDAGAPLCCLTTTFTYDAEFFQKQCLGRFLRLENQPVDELSGQVPDLAFVIEQEERFAQVQATVVVDRSQTAESRNLRVDILPVGLQRGVQHAKASILVWENVARFIVASANLTEPSYRSTVEVATVLDAGRGSEIPVRVFLDLLAAVRSIVDLSRMDPTTGGPRQRALATLETAEIRVRALGLPEAFRRGDPVLTVIPSAPGKPALPALASTLGSPIRKATVLSPFFDPGEAKSPAAEALANELAKRGEANVTFVVSTGRTESASLIQAPETIKHSMPSRIAVEFRPYEAADTDDTRMPHAKAIALEENDRISVMVGSSNFTASGLGVAKNYGNIELNVAMTLRSPKRKARKELMEIFRCGEPLKLEEVVWHPHDETDEDLAVLLPWGFQDFLLEPGTPHLVRMWFGNPSDLPSNWTVRDPSGRVLLSSEEWEDRGQPTEYTAPVEGDHTPFLVSIRWEVPDGEQEISWPLNVTDPALLPPPAQLRDLRSDVLLEALSATGPIHQSLARAIQRATSSHHPTRDLDPLRRYSTTGRFLQRARAVAAALEGLRARLERPAATEEGLAWRLGGPLGPLALARALLRDVSGASVVPGEANFHVAELALTLSRVDWSASENLLGKRLVRLLVAQTIDELKKLHYQAESAAPSGDSHLVRYIAQALSEASR